MYSNLVQFMKDPYANYVLQQAIDLAEPSQRKVLVNKMMPFLWQVRRFMYAKRIVTKVDRIVTKGSYKL